MKDNKKSRWDLRQFEKMMLPGWVFHPEHEETRRMTIIAYISVFIAVLTLILLGSLRLIRHDTVYGLIDLVFALVMAGIIIYHRKTKGYGNFLPLNIGVTAFGVFCICLFLFGGFDRAAYLWSYTFPLMVFPLGGTRRGTIAMIVFLIPISLFLLLDPAIPLTIPYPRGFAFTFIPSILVVAGLSYLYERNREKNRQQLNVINAALQQSNEDMEQQIQKRTAELAQSEEKYRFLTERMSDVVWTTDLGLNVTYISPSVERTLGFTQDEFRRLPVHERITPESLNKATAILATELEREKMPGVNPERNLQIELEFCHKTGSTVWLECMVNTIRDDKGNLVGFHGVSRDITERTILQEEHKQLQERLHRAEKMEALGTLAGGVAHDLNNVLGVLVGYSEMLLEKLPDNSPLKRYANNIFQSGMRGAATIQDLLTLARRGVIVSEIVDLNKVVFDYFQSPEFEKLISCHPGITIENKFEDGLLNIKGSPVHLGKTIMNLVSNAAEAISGEGKVTIRTENRYLDHPIQGYDEMQAGNYAVLTVSDTGSGISAHDLAKIFEPFYTKKVMGRSGTGLGLAVVWGTVKDHQGYIDVQSEEGKGSTFTLYFPLTREEPAIVEKPSSPISSYMGKGESLLVVDDVREQRELAMSILESLGYRVEAVASGEEAIEYTKHKKTDLLILDMIMEPGLDGMETYRKILEITPGQKAIIVSGFSETDHVRKSLEMGAGAFVRKPYILEKIGLAVRKELDRKQES